MKAEGGNAVRRLALLAALAIAAMPAHAQTATATPAQKNQPPAVSRNGAGFGVVDFPVSCAPAVQGEFDTAVAMLHSFQYQQAGQTFTQISQQDPTCAMAWWGMAMSLYHQLWDWPNADRMKQGLADTIEAQKLRAKTERERMYIVSAGVFFQNNPTLSRAARVQAYSNWMNRIFTKYKDDVNAGAFYALSLVALAQDGVNAEANREQAISVLDKLLAVAPDNPGVLHYLIHAADTPELAPQGLAAARRYAAIAPDSAHALHMPSHIFVRLGLWRETIQSNLASEAAAAAATKAGTGDARYQFHAMNFLDYAYLQSGEMGQAEALVGALQDVPGASPAGIAANEALLRARNALELHEWNVAASLPIPDAPPAQQDVTYFVRAIGAARNGDAAGAQLDVGYLNQVTAALRASPAPTGEPPASGPTLEQQEAQAWLLYAQGHTAGALGAMRAAADEEEKAGVDGLTMPAREMLADMLLGMKRPGQALKAYKAALVESPNRFDALYGAARAAKLAGYPRTARVYLGKLVKMCGPHADRPEVEAANAELGKK